MSVILHGATPVGDFLTCFAAISESSIGAHRILQPPPRQRLFLDVTPVLPVRLAIGHLHLPGSFSARSAANAGSSYSESEARTARRAEPRKPTSASSCTIAVTCHEHGNVDCVDKADLEGIDGEGYIGALFAASLRHGQVPGLNPRMH